MTPLPDLLAAVPTLQHPAEPYTYRVEGPTIVGSWDIVRATSLYPNAVEHLDKSYTITVEFDTAKGEYDFTERRVDKQLNAGAGGISGEGSFFKGKSTMKEKSFSFGGVNKTDEGVSAAPLSYSFDTDQIKQPLFAFLEQHGWRRKKSFLGCLFS